MVVVWCFAGAEYILGSAIQMTDRDVRPLPDTFFPPDRWLFQSEVERREVLREMAASGRRPSKLEYAEWEEHGIWHGLRRRHLARPAGPPPHPPCAKGSAARACTAHRLGTALAYFLAFLSSFVFFFSSAHVAAPAALGGRRAGSVFI